ncbi:MAG: hypothetical protein FJ216_06700 [Ignavibacteria bacterium]|nr:hypothetical protein [Ignavibacteria bacterium]
MLDSKNEIKKEQFTKAREQFDNSINNLLQKIKLFVEKYNSQKEENKLLKENIKDLNNKVNEIKLQLTKLNTDIVLKDKELSKLKNLLLDKDSGGLQDRAKMKTRIKNLITRIDGHLQQVDDE